MRNCLSCIKVLLLLSLPFSTLNAQRIFYVNSPDKELSLEIRTGDILTYNASFWQRPLEFYGYESTRKCTIWEPCEDNPADVILRGSSAEDTVAVHWIKLGNFSLADPPSGLLPNQANAADKEFAARGINFRMPKLL